MSYSIKIFSPSFNLFSLSTSIKKSNYEAYHKEILHTLKEAICYNQGAIAQYEYIASKIHKKMRIEYQTSKNKDMLKKYCDKLEKHLYGEMIKAFNKNSTYAKECFKERRRLEPRVCVKLYEKNSETGKGEIVDFYRDSQLYKSPNYPIDRNKGFNNVITSGKWYLCNNIPENVRKNNYENPRLNNGRANLFNLSLLELYKINKKEKADPKWINCWEDIEDQEGPERRPTDIECYKSVMIIPMTLIGNDLYPEFTEDFQIDPEDDRAIYGFLCIDHHTIEYFKDVPDSFVGYIFADLMSLYKIVELKFTRFSSTYQEVKKMIED